MGARDERFGSQRRHQDYDENNARVINISAVTYLDLHISKLKKILAYQQKQL